MPKAQKRRTTRRKTGGWDMSSLKKAKPIKMFDGLGKISTERIRRKSSMTHTKPPVHSSKRIGT